MSNKKHTGLTRRTSGLMALEQRFMFDGAAIDTAHDQLVDATVLDTVQLVSGDVFRFDASTSGLASAAQLAQQQVRDYLTRATDAQLFELFNGGKTAPDSQWTERLSSLREALANGSFAVNVVAMDSASQFTALAAFTENGPNGEPTIFINTYWFGMLDAPDTSRALVEELGHAFDAYLNPNADSAGDEGESFADTVIDGSVSQDQSTALLTQNDHGQVVVNGVSYDVEFASFSFANAYEMVYDLNNSSNTYGVTTNAIDTTERWASKEQNLHYFNTSNPLQITTVSDGTSMRDFSGNDVSGALAVTIGSTTYYGWISRPIKVGGIVEGFYFWTDTDFITLNLAQTDGNQDGDSSILDNRGFVLVVDQAYFDTLGSTSYTINNAKDGNLGSVAVKSIGSSSDKVDAALNSVLPPNEVTAVADSLSVTEDSGPSTGNLLSNDSDPNGDSFTLTSYTISGLSGSQMLGSNVNISGVGTINISSTGAYTFTPIANYTGPVPVITYTITDAYGATSTATFSINVTAVNDPPVATDDSVTTSENVPKVLTLNDFGTYSDPESDPLAKIQITQLATNGTLEYWDGSNWVNVTLTQELTPTQILQGQVRFTPDSNESGSNYATVQFKVSDGQVYSTSAYTLTVHVTADNQAPVANADVNSVAEAGCGVTAAPATGNVISGGTADTDANGGTLTVTNITAYGVTQSVSSGTTSANGSSITGQYGTLTIGANGSYSYALNNSLAAIDAMNSVATKTEIFTYTLSDGQGGTASTTLTLTINGTNDDPVAVDDFSSIREGSLIGSNYGTVSGNALSNDGDVDSSLSIGGSYATAVGSAQGSSTYSFTVSNSINSGNYVFYDDDGNASTRTVVSTNSAATGEAVRLTVDYGGATYDMLVDTTSVSGTTFKIVVGGSNISVSLNDNKQGYVFQNNSGSVGFSANSDASGNYKVSVVTGQSSSSSTTVNISNVTSGVIAAGMTVTNGSDTRTVNSVVKDATGNVTSVVLDSAVTWSGESLAFSSTASPLALTGKYGSISINTATGAYTYTLTSDALNDGEIFDEKFSYRATDGSCTDDAVITVRIVGASAPYLRNDVLEVAEDSGAHVTFNGSAGNTASDTLKTNDDNGTSVTLGNVTSFKVAGDNTSYTAGTTANIAGVGTLKINADGTIDFNPIDNYVGPVPAVTYTRVDANNSSSFFTANLTITIQSSDDASILAPDTKTVPEDTTAVGNVLTNDSDVDNVLAVTSYTWLDGSSTINGTLGSATNITDNGVTVGVLTLNANGSYSFVPAANWNGTVPVITYTTNTGLTSTLTITITPVSDASPVLDLDASASGTGYTTTYTVAGSAVAIGDTDTTITDSDDANMASAVIVLANPQSGDSLSAGTLPTGISATTSNVGGVITVTLTGSATKADYQTAIAAIAFSSTGSSTVDRVVSVKVNDADNDSNTAYTTITVTPDNRTLTVTGTTVNETSPYVQFQVGGVTGQWVSLSLGETTNASGNATMGTDFLPNLQYFNGSTWVNYTGGLVQIPSGNTLLVRTPVVQDLANEGAETLNLTAKNQSQVANNSAGVSGVSTIKDDGTGDVFDGNNNTSVPTFTDPGANANPNTDAKVLDDDRPLAVNSIQVNEASPFGVFTVTGAANQWTKLSLAAGTATSGGTDFGASSGTGLQYWSGSAWATYTAGAYVKLDAGGKLLVRTPITNDVPFEGSETFFLVAQNTGGKTANGTGTILDDGTGTKYPDVNPGTGPAPVTDSTNLNDDRTIDVVGGVTFNEASTYATFTVTGQSGYEINLTLGNVSGTSATISGFTFDYSVDGGASWQTYSWNGTSGNRPMIPGSTSAGGSTGIVLVRVNITSEADTPYEGAEPFTLTASYATNSSLTDVDTDTIIDDGTGKIDNDGDGGADEGGAKDDDRVPAAPASSPVLPPPAAGPITPFEPAQPLPPAKPAVAFNSELAPIAPALKPIEPPQPLAATLTSAGGPQFVASEAAPPGLTLFAGVTDQFIQTTDAATKISLPYDAFIHSNKEAVIKLQAKQADDSPLPKWVEFDPAAGTFTVKPPKDFKGKLDLKVIARDDDGREAVAIFQMFVGEQDQNTTKPQSRTSFTEKLRMAGKRPVTLVRVAEGAHNVQKVRAG